MATITSDLKLQNDPSTIVHPNIESGNIPANAVTTAQIDDGAITAPKLSAGVVSTAKIADGAITTVKIADGSITSAKLGALSVGNGNIQNSAVTGDKIASNAVTQIEMKTFSDYLYHAFSSLANFLSLMDLINDNELIKPVFEINEAGYIIPVNLYFKDDFGKFEIVFYSLATSSMVVKTIDTESAWSTEIVSSGGDFHSLKMYWVENQ